jgi:acyl-CoA thioesterase-1
MMRVPLLAVLITLATLVPRPGGAAEKTLLVLGDSLSAAYGLATDEGWVSLLADRLDRLGLGYGVVNASISGETTAGGLTRLPGLLESNRPDVLVIALGANDGLRGFDLKTLRANLSRLAELGQAAGAQVLMAGVRLPPNYGGAYTRRFEAVFREVAAAAGVPLVPYLLKGVAEDRGLMQADGLHPTAAAQPVILENLWPAIEPLVAGAPP